MSDIVATHRQVIEKFPNGTTKRVRSTIHFTRTEVRAAYAEAARKTQRDLPSKCIEVYEGEDVVIVDLNLP